MMSPNEDLPMFDTELDRQFNQVFADNDLRRGRVAGLRMAQQLQAECEKHGSDFQHAVTDLISFEESKIDD